MGSHYVPQHYLRNFSTAEDNNQVWMFDKESGLWTRAAIKRVAQEAGFFTPEDEKRLAVEVESPASILLKRLLRREELTSSERQQFALYVSVMIMRVPAKRREAAERIPEALESTVAEARVVFTEVFRDRPERLAWALGEIDKAAAKFSVTPPPEVMEQVNSPWPSTEMVSAVDRMVWRLIQPYRGMEFLTCDNPSYFFRSYGVGTEHAEISFPLSPSLAFVGSHQGPPGSTVFLDGTRALTMEINRRVASGTERFAFFPRHADWVRTLVMKKNPFLSRIVW